MADAPDAAPPARSNGSESPAPEPVAEPEPVPTALCPVCNLPEHPPATKYTASGEVVTVQCLLGPTRPAIFASKRCVGCDQKIEIGQSISYALGMWVHAMCGVKLLHPSTPSAEELIAKIETHTTNAEFVRVLEVVFTAQGHIMILATAGTGKTTVLSILVKIVSAEMAIACMFAKMNVVHAFEKGIIFASTYHSICFRAMGSALRSNTSSAWSWDSAIIDDDDSISVLSMEMHVAALMQQIYPISHAGNSRTNKALNELFNPSVAKAVNLGMQQCFGLPNGPIVNTANFRKLFDEFHITHELHELWDADKVDMEAVDDYLRMHYNIELHPEDAEGNDIQDHVHNNGEFSITCALTEFAIMLTKRIFIGMVDSFWTGAFEGHTQMMYLDANLQQEILPVGACSFTLVVYLVVSAPRREPHPRDSNAIRGHHHGSSSHPFCAFHPRQQAAFFHSAILFSPCVSSNPRQNPSALQQLPCPAYLFSNSHQGPQTDARALMLAASPSHALAGEARTDVGEALVQVPAARGDPGHDAAVHARCAEDAL